MKIKYVNIPMFKDGNRTFICVLLQSEKDGVVSNSGFVEAKKCELLSTFPVKETQAGNVKKFFNVQNSK